MTGEAYDVVILGGGNAAFGVTVPTRKAGLKVAMVEARDLGGTCPNRGCTPKKVLVAAAHALHEIGQAHVHCISAGKPSLDWAALIDREKELISGIPESLAETLQERGVELIRDQANSSAPMRSRPVGGHSRPSTSSSPPARGTGRCRSGRRADDHL